MADVVVRVRGCSKLCEGNTNWCLAPLKLLLKSAHKIHLSIQTATYPSASFPLSQKTAVDFTTKPVFHSSVEPHHLTNAHLPDNSLHVTNQLHKRTSLDGLKNICGEYTWTTLLKEKTCDHETITPIKVTSLLCIRIENDTNEEIYTPKIEQEDWIEYIQRSIYEAMEKMENAKIRCWNKTHKRMKWRLALRIANLPSERWLVKAADWNPEFSSKYKTNGAIGRPRRRWEDDINEFLKLEKNEVENSIEGDNKYNKSWIKAAKDSGRWTLLENDCTMNAEERSEGNARLRRNTQSRPARCVNGVRLRDGSHNTKSKRRSK